MKTSPGRTVRLRPAGLRSRAVSVIFLKWLIKPRIRRTTMFEGMAKFSYRYIPLSSVTSSRQDGEQLSYRECDRDSLISREESILRARLSMHALNTEEHRRVVSISPK